MPAEPPRPSPPPSRGQVATLVAAFVTLTLAPLLELPFAEVLDEQQIDWPDVVGELSVAALALVWLAALTRVATSRRVFAALSVGMLSLYVGGLWDVLDEVAVLPLGNVVENLGKVLGAAFSSLAFVLWWRGSRRTQRRLQARAGRYQRLSVTDGPTSLFNRQHFEEALAQRLPRAAADPPLSLIMMDLDDFKAHNDTYGHLAGDVVIARLAAIVREDIRETDVPCRYGGEEFAVILPSASREEAARVAERIRASLAAEVFEPVAGARVRKTISLGVVEAVADEGAEALKARCDQALYAAKRGGKDRVVVS